MTNPSDLIAVLRSLRAVRAFAARDVPEETIAGILDVARWTGSGMNAQPWELILIRDRATLARLGQISPNAGHVAGAPLAIAVVMAGAWAGEPYDEGRLTERIMLAAKAFGLGTGIGWFNTPESSAAAKELLGVPSERILRTVIAIGYPAPVDETRPKREQPRKPLADFVYDERHGVPHA